MANGKCRDKRREVGWRRIVREQKKSGLSIRDFCRRGKLKESAFYFWRRELHRRNAEQEQSHHVTAGPAFLPVRVEKHVDGLTAAGHIEIELSGGRRVHVTAPVDRQALADVLAVLEGRPC